MCISCGVLLCVGQSFPYRDISTCVPVSRDRYKMHKVVYKHKTVTAIEEMIVIPQSRLHGVMRESIWIALYMKSWVKTRYALETYQLLCYLSKTINNFFFLKFIRISILARSTRYTNRLAKSLLNGFLRHIRVLLKENQNVSTASTFPRNFGALKFNAFWWFTIGFLFYSLWRRR